MGTSREKPIKDRQLGKIRISVDPKTSKLLNEKRPNVFQRLETKKVTSKECLSSSSIAMITQQIIQ